MFDGYKDIISVKEMQEMLRISRPTAYRLLESEEIFHRKIGKKYIIPKQSVIEYLAKD